MTRRRIRLRLRHAMDLYERRTGRPISYPELAKKAGLSPATIESIGSRSDYNTTLRTLERLCVALRVTPSELLDWH
jgi:DNA-binding Xre family transcriptional regulator